ncbi:MAG TPA: dual specificity protein phosphatase family protein, partial [candidate division Zixibacteria bacterium]|nr:dual specificity protein phosphatase family protein [candidate division Zixibacteria bacterium]
IDEGVAVIDQQIKEGDVVLIHYAKGRGRSATLLAAYLMKHDQMTYDQANQLMLSKRSLVNLQARHQRVLEAWYAGQEEKTETALGAE